MYPVSALQAVLAPRSGAGKQASDREERLKLAVERLQKSGIMRVQGADKVASIGTALGIGKSLLGASKAVWPKITGVAGRSAAAVPAAAKAVEGVAAAAPAAGEAATYANRAAKAFGGWKEPLVRAGKGMTQGFGADTLAGMVDVDTGGMGTLTGGLMGAIGGRRGRALLQRLPEAWRPGAMSAADAAGGYMRAARPTLNTAGGVGFLGDIQSARSDGAINVARPFDMMRNSQQRLADIAQSPEASEYIKQNLTEWISDPAVQADLRKRVGGQLMESSGSTIRRMLEALGRGANSTREAFSRGYNGGQRYTFE